MTVVYVKTQLGIGRIHFICDGLNSISVFGIIASAVTPAIFNIISISARHLPPFQPILVPTNVFAAAPGMAVFHLWDLRQYTIFLPPGQGHFLYIDRNGHFVLSTRLHLRYQVQSSISIGVSSLNITFHLIMFYRCDQYLVGIRRTGIEFFTTTSNRPSSKQHLENIFHDIQVDGQV